MAIQARPSLGYSLIDVSDSVLVVIDVQEYFLAKLPSKEAAGLVDRIGWLIDVAIRLNIPIVVTAEDIPTLGGVVPAIANKLPPESFVFNKMAFGLGADGDIVAAVEDTGRNTAILVGLETDVCVAQSALGLVQRGYEVVVAADATSSPGSGYEVGLERIRQAGVLVSSVKSLYYEWIRTVAQDHVFTKRFGSPPN